MEESIREKIVKSDSIVISRVPVKTIDLFKGLAREEFVNDYGMLLHHLVLCYVGLVPTGWEHLEVLIEKQGEEIEKLKAEVFKPVEEKKRKMLGG